MKNKTHKRFVVAKVNPWQQSKSIPGTYVSKVELLDVDNDFAWCYTWVDENNFNYAQWQKVFDIDYTEYAPVIEGFFANKKEKDLISADAKFTIIEQPQREVILPLIGEKIGII